MEPGGGVGVTPSPYFLAGNFPARWIFSLEISEPYKFSSGTFVDFPFFEPEKPGRTNFTPTFLQFSTFATEVFPV